MSDSERESENRAYRKHHLRMMRQHPGKITPAQYKAFVLSTADKSGRLWPPPLGDGCARYSLLIGMHLAGEIDVRSRPDEPMRWYLPRPRDDR